MFRGRVDLNLNYICIIWIIVKFLGIRVNVWRGVIVEMKGVKRFEFGIIF